MRPATATDEKKPRKIPYYTNGMRRQGELDSEADRANLVAFEDAMHGDGSGAHYPRLMTPTFVPLTDPINPRAAGITYPSTIHGWRGLYRHPMSAAEKPVQSSASTFKCLPARNISHPAGSNRGIMIISE
jgi:hypothetical protein